MLWEVVVVLCVFDDLRWEVVVVLCVFDDLRWEVVVVYFHVSIRGSIIKSVGMWNKLKPPQPLPDHNSAEKILKVMVNTTRFIQAN
jgi:hypothetical protein